MQCVILAGGPGIRMRPLTSAVPKAMIPVLGRPFAHYQLAWLSNQGVEQVVYNVGYQGEVLRDYVQDGRSWNLSVRYVDDGPTLRGTAGALRLALDQGALDDSFFVLYGDSFLPVELAPVAEAFATSRAPALMTVFRNRGQWDQSNVLYRDGKVELYDKARADPRSAQMEHIDYGLAVLTRDVIRARVPPDTTADLAFVYRALSGEGLLAGFEVTQRFYEIGSLAGLEALETYLRSKVTP